MRIANPADAVLLAVAILTFAACGSSGGHAASAPTPAPTTAPSPAAPTTTRPAPPTTHRPNPVNEDQRAELVLTLALNAAHAAYVRTYDFTTVSPASLTAAVPNVKFVALGQASASAVGVLTQDRHDVFFVTRSASGRWFCVTENDTDGVSYGTGTSFSAVDSNGKCQSANW